MLNVNYGFLNVAVEVHPDMRPLDLARCLDSEVDDVLITLIELNGTRHIQSEYSRIGSLPVLQAFAKRVGVKIKVVKNPNAASDNEEEENRDYVPQPPPSPEDLKVI